MKCINCDRAANEYGFCQECFTKEPSPPRWPMERFISWAFRLDHWTRKPLMFVSFPLALLKSLWTAIPNGRAFTFGYWDLEWRMWWVTWDGMLIDKRNRTTWNGKNR